MLKARETQEEEAAAAAEIAQPEVPAYSTVATPVETDEDPALFIEDEDDEEVVDVATV